MAMGEESGTKEGPLTLTEIVLDATVAAPSHISLTLVLGNPSLSPCRNKPRDKGSRWYGILYGDLGSKQSICLCSHFAFGDSNAQSYGCTQKLAYWRERQALSSNGPRATRGMMAQFPFCWSGYDDLHGHGTDCIVVHVSTQSRFQTRDVISTYTQL
ncbi:hypothetical protein IAQ61_000314 [Plenodomus lingam]|uniref:uncharacterized protein n=1 Tax=Leptosphaeria maculans TaxID=5022 RepID=UPI0033295E1A|nr:hypothetical protein IAQ61_000314 [Plenodomus lingam]